MSSWKMPHVPRSGVLYYGTDAGSASQISMRPMGAYTAPDLGTVKPVENVIDTHGKHTLVYSRMSRAYFDKAPIRGLTYLGKFKTDEEAIACWRGWLRSQGVDA